MAKFKSLMAKFKSPKEKQPAAGQARSGMPGAISARRPLAGPDERAPFSQSVSIQDHLLGRKGLEHAKAGSWESAFEAGKKVEDPGLRQELFNYLNSLLRFRALDSAKEGAFNADWDVAFGFTNLMQDAKPKASLKVKLDKLLARYANYYIRESGAKPAMLGISRIGGGPKRCLAWSSIVQSIGPDASPHATLGEQKRHIEKMGADASAAGQRLSFCDKRTKELNVELLKLGGLKHMMYFTATHPVLLGAKIDDPMLRDVFGGEITDLMNRLAEMRNWTQLLIDSRKGEILDIIKAKRAEMEKEKKRHIEKMGADASAAGQRLSFCDKRTKELNVELFKLGGLKDMMYFTATNQVLLGYKIDDPMLRDVFGGEITDLMNRLAEMRDMTQSLIDSRKGEILDIIKAKRAEMEKEKEQLESERPALEKTYDRCRAALTAHEIRKVVQLAVSKIKSPQIRSMIEEKVVGTIRDFLTIAAAVSP